MRRPNVTLDRTAEAVYLLQVARVKKPIVPRIVPKSLAARAKTRTTLRANLRRQLSVAKSAKYSSISVFWRLGLAKNPSLSNATDSHHGLLGLRVSVRAT